MMRKLVLAALLIFPAQAAIPYANGLGATTLTCVDVDGDGYGTGSGCTGRDADDFDATIHTGAEAITKYGTLAAFLSHRGYTPTNIYYISPSGVNAGSPPACKNNAAAPCATYAYIKTSLAANDMVLWRTGSYTEANIQLVNGSSNQPIIYMAYPGEVAVIDHSGTGAIAMSLATSGAQWLVIDSMDVTGTAGSSGCIGGGTPDGAGARNTHDLVFRYIHAYGNCGLGGIALFNGLENVIAEYGSYHGNTVCGTCQHGLYWGSRDIPSVNITMRRNLVYGNGAGGYDGLDFNGRVTNLRIEQNIVYGNGGGGIIIQMGVSASFVRGNLVFNNSKGLVVTNYPGDCSTQTGGDPSGVICPYDVTGNLIENNTVYQPSNDPIDGSSGAGSSPALIVSNRTIPLSGFLGGNTYRNNILVGYGNGGKPPAWYADNAGGVNNKCGAECLTYFAADVWDNNLFYQTSGSATTPFLIWTDAYTTRSCAQATSLTTISNLCSFADPQFITASPTYWATPSLLNLRLGSASPAKAAGVLTGVPANDVYGRGYLDDSPSLGAVQYNYFTQGWNRLTGAQINSSIAPANGASGSVCGAGGSGCSGSGVPYPYQSTFGSVLRAWSGAWLRTLPGGNKMCMYGSGHNDGGNNEVYCLNFNLATPTMTRVTNPSTLVAADFANCPEGLPSSSPVAPNAVHSYGWLAYMPTVDKGFRYGGGKYCGNGFSSTTSWAFDFVSSTWAAKDSVNCTGGCGFSVNGPTDPATFNSSLYGYSVWDSARQSVWSLIGSSGTLVEYFPQANTINANANQYILRGLSLGFPSDSSGHTLDTRRNRVWFAGNGNVSYVSLVGSHTWTNVSSSLDSSCAALKQIAGTENGPGIAYSSIRDAIIAWLPNGGNSYYQLDPATLTCTQVVLTGGPPNGSNNAGIYNRWQYVESLDSFLIVNDINQDAYLLQLDAEPTPPPSGPSITTLTLPAGTQGTSYSQTLATAGGTGAVTCAITSGSLAGSGLNLNSNCTITGTAGSPAAYPFTATPTDANSVVGSGRALSITINAYAGGYSGTFTGVMK